jgi:hypothetical protein
MHELVIKAKTAEQAKVWYEGIKTNIHVLKHLKHAHKAHAQSSHHKADGSFHDAASHGAAAHIHKHEHAAGHGHSSGAGHPGEKRRTSTSSAKRAIC